MQNNMLITINGSKSKPEVEFQYMYIRSFAPIQLPWMWLIYDHMAAPLIGGRKLDDFVIFIVL